MELLKQKITELFGGPVNTPKDCGLLAQKVWLSAGRQISSTTLRRFFGLLPSPSSISRYNLDTLSIFCGYHDFSDYCEQHQHQFEKKENFPETLAEFERITQFTLSGIRKKCLSDFDLTIARKELEKKLEIFLDTDYRVYPLVAPGGYGKSVALARWSICTEKNADICLFCTADLFVQLLDESFKKKVESSAAYRQVCDIFCQMKDRGRIRSQKIIILDAVDEIANNQGRFERFLFYLAGLAEPELPFKIILGVREQAWKDVKKHIEGQNDLGRAVYPLQESMQTGFTNLFPFSIKEAKQLITIYREKAYQGFTFESLPLNMQELIRIPINFYYFIEMYQSQNWKGYISGTGLSKLFLQKLVFLSKHAEYKEDILYTLVDLMEGARAYRIDKNLLKKQMPVHLKRETGYYTGYKELLDKGILHEERCGDLYGFYSTYSGFRHQNYFFFMAAIHQIRKNNGLSAGLFVNIINQGQDAGYTSGLFSILFEMAYDNEDYTALENFCDHPAEILSAMPVRLAVGESFRKNNSIRDRLVSKFAADRNGQLYFFEEFVDTNYLYNNYTFRITEYLKYKQTSEALLFGNCILYLSAFLQLDREKCLVQSNIIGGLLPTPEIHPWPIGRRVACLLLHGRFIEKDREFPIEKLIRESREIAYQYPSYLEFGLVAFELPVMIALALMEEYVQLIELADNAIVSYSFGTNEDPFFHTISSNWNRLPYWFREYARFKQGLELPVSFGNELEKEIDMFQTIYDDFQFKILLDYFLSDIYYAGGEHEKSEEYFKSALDLAHYAGYTCLTAWLMVHNPEAKQDLLDEGKLLFDKAGFLI